MMCKRNQYPETNTCEKETNKQHTRLCLYFCILECTDSVHEPVRGWTVAIDVAQETLHSEEQGGHADADYDVCSYNTQPHAEICAELHRK